MTTEELYDKLKLIQKMKCETQNLELKSAEQGYPKRLYDSLSSFSNQDDGGVYDLSNCPIPDYPNCLETAQSCVHNSSF